MMMMMMMATNDTTTTATNNDDNNNNDSNLENITKSSSSTTTTTTTTTISMNKSSMGQGDDKELIEKLLRMVKREVKQIMEEAVTRKFVHEDSGSITSLCGEFLFIYFFVEKQAKFIFY